MVHYRLYRAEVIYRWRCMRIDRLDLPEDERKFAKEMARAVLFKAAAEFAASNK